MQTISLLKSTGNQRVDDILRGVIGIFETIFPDRIRGYYLVGSYADGTAVSTSDIDMKILFKNRFRDNTERKNARQICECCFGLISPIPGDVTANDEETAFSSSTLRLRIKAGSLLIYGEDIRDQISLPSLDQHIRDVMFRAYVFCFTDRLRPNLKARVWPLDYPDPSDEFYGYTYKGDTTVFTSVVGAVATAIVASKAKKYVFTKNDCLKLYKKYINDKWTVLLEVVFGKIREQWEYQIPRNKEERQQLRGICRQALAFENHFLIIYKDFLLTELRDAEDEDKLLAVKRLGEIIYPDEETLDALKALESCANREMREVVNNTINWIRQMREKN